MPKYRQLHLKILDSIDVQDMPDDFTRLSWVLLSLVVDGAGRGIDNPAWVRAKMYPLREDVTMAQIAAAMDWYTKRGMIGRYEADGRKYFYIVKWSAYQSGTEKEAKSVIPEPDLLRTYSGLTPELLRVNTIQEQCNTNTMQEQSAPDEFSLMQRTVETITGYPANPKDMAAIDEFIKTGVIEADIKAAVSFFAGIGKTARGAADLRNSVMMAKGKRIQGGARKVEQYVGPNGEVMEL